MKKDRHVTITTGKGGIILMLRGFKEASGGVWTEEDQKNAEINVENGLYLIDSKELQIKKL